MTNVAVVCADSIPREGMRLLLKRHSPISNVKSFESAETLIRHIERSSNFDLCIVDLDIGGMGGFEALAELNQRWPDTPVLVITSQPASHVTVRSLRSGARGFISYSQDPQELFDAIDLILRGGRSVGASHIDLIINAVAQPESQLPHDRLSNREFEIMRRIAAGHSLQSIADDLCISAKTVSTYRRRMLQKMDFQRNAQLTQYALEHSLLDRVG